MCLSGGVGANRAAWLGGILASPRRGGQSDAVRTHHLACVFSLLAALMGCGPVSSPFTITLELLNPSDNRFEGSGGSQGTGLELRVDGVEGGQELYVDTVCNGRICGDVQETNPGRCGVEPKSVDPRSGLRMTWDGMYFPRSRDAWGECLGPKAAVRPGTVKVNLCGRMFGPDIRNSALHCEASTFTVADDTQEATVRVNVPGSVL